MPLLKKALKTILISIFTISILSTGMVCSADETTTAVATTMSNSSSTSTHKTTTKQSESTTTVDATTTTSVGSVTTTETTTQDTTTMVETTTVPQTTTTLEETTTTTTTETSEEATDQEDKDVYLTTLSPQERIEYVQDEIDSILYGNSKSNEQRQKVIVKYLYRVTSKEIISSNEMLYFYKYAKNVLDKQLLESTSKEKFLSSMDKCVQSVDKDNYKSIQSYCNSTIKNAFYNGILTNKEVLTLTKDINERIHKAYVSKLSGWELDLETYSDYTFTSNQALVTQWNQSYPDMKGWIFIKDTNIDYPLMQYPYDNDYYLQHSWNGAESSRGTIEFDYRCTFNDYKDDTQTTNTILIYGHNLSDDTMFSQLAYYKDVDYYSQHPLIEISTDTDQRLYKIYACCSISGLAADTNFMYWNEKYINMDEDTFNEHIALTKQTMLYDTNDFPEYGQDILTLQTCDGNDGMRVVIFAKRVK